ncbi:MAG: hypothetical protein BJG00_003395 [Limnothrix sp. CACIAM 69d]|nr:MAG: hypothetical protein BJG00_003395 [Limnothrix sp. CACIAM 69d]
MRLDLPIALFCSPGSQSGESCRDQRQSAQFFQDRDRRDPRSLIAAIVSIRLYRFWVNLGLTVGLSGLDLVSIQPRVQRARPLI